MFTLTQLGLFIAYKDISTIREVNKLQSVGVHLKTCGRQSFGRLISFMFMRMLKYSTTQYSPIQFHQLDLHHSSIKF